MYQEQRKNLLQQISYLITSDGDLCICQTDCIYLISIFGTHFKWSKFCDDLKLV